MPTVVTYSCSARSSYEPISCRTCASLSCPSAISFSSLMNESWRCPVAGFVAQAAATAMATYVVQAFRPAMADLKVCTTSDGGALLRERMLECSHQQDDEPRRRTVAHQAHAPDLSRKRTEAAADLDAELFEQQLADRGVVHALRDLDGVEAVQAIAFRRKERQANRRQPFDECLVIPLVARPPRVEPFFVHDVQRFVQRAEQRRRHRVVVLPVDPVVLQEAEVEVEARTRGGLLERARREDNRPQARRGPEAFLRAAVADVHAPGADLELD